MGKTASAKVTARAAASVDVNKNIDMSKESFYIILRNKNVKVNVAKYQREAERIGSTIRVLQKERVDALLLLTLFEGLSDMGRGVDFFRIFDKGASGSEFTELSDCPFGVALGDEAPLFLPKWFEAPFPNKRVMKIRRG